MFDSAKLNQSIDEKRFKDAISDAKEELIELCLEPLGLKIREFSDKKDDYLGNIDDYEAMYKEILEEYSKLENKIHSLKYRDGDDEAKVSNRIRKVSDEACKAHDSIEALIDKSIQIIGENSNSMLEAKKQKITRIIEDIGKTYKEMKAKTKRVTDSINGNSKNVNYLKMLEIQKDYNTSVKRKLESLAIFTGNETMQEINERLSKTTGLEEVALALYSKYEKEIQEYNNSCQSGGIQYQRTKPKAQPSEPVKLPQEQNNVTIKEEDLKINVEQGDIMGVVEQVDEPQDVRNYTVTFILSAMASIKVKKYPKFDLEPYANKVFKQIENNLSKTMIPACARDVAILLIHNIG